MILQRGLTFRIVSLSPPRLEVVPNAEVKV